MLSEDTKKKFRQALASKGFHDYAEDLIAAIDSNGSGPAAHVSNIEPTSNLPSSNASLSTTDTYTDAAVKAAIDGAVDALGSASEARLDAIEAKIDAILAALQGAGMMS